MTTAQRVGAVAPTVKLNGQLLSADLLGRVTSLKIDRALNMSGRAVLRFDDPGYVVSTDRSFAVGGKVQIYCRDSLLFGGEVTGVELVHQGRTVDFLVTVDDAAYHFGLGTKITTFQQQKASDVVGTLANSYGLRAAASATTQMMPYLIHAGTDLDLLNDLAARAGYDWWVDDQTVHFAAPTDTGPTAVELGDDLLEFSLRTTALHPGSTAITGWWSDTKAAVTATAAASSVPVKPNGALVNDFVKASQLAAMNKMTNAGFSPSSQGEAQSVANGLAQRWVSQAVTARGLTDVNPVIALGAAIAVSNAGPSSGRYHVTALQHSYSRTGFTTRFTAGDRRPSGLVDSLGDSRSGVGRLGLQIGVVTAVEGTGEHAGKVKVKFPALSDTVESNWARVAAIGGGASRGLTFLPEVNDEVLVGFESGDFKRPIVLGGLFNKRDVMSDPGVQNGKVQRRRITSRAGHAIELSDEDGNAKQYISLTLAGGAHTVKLSKEQLDVTVPSGVPIVLKSGSAGITIGKQGEITIEGQKITLKATQDVEISGLNVTTKATVKSETSATTLAMKANAQAEMSAGGQVAIKGAMVMIN